MSEWISVQERLPEESDVVLAYGANAPTWVHEVALWEDGLWQAGAVSDCSLVGVTHWMPLPPPPEPQLTVKEALREALAILSLLANRECGGTQWTQSEIAKAIGRLPRLRAALEAE